MEMPCLDEEQEGQLWQSLEDALSPADLRDFCQDLAVPALTPDEQNNSRFFETVHMPACIFKLLSMHAIKVKDRRNYTWDAVGPGFGYPEVILDRLTERSFDLLHERDLLPAWLLELSLAIDLGL
jgi:hypothetical protein